MFFSIFAKEANFSGLFVRQDDEMIHYLRKRIYSIRTIFAQEESFPLTAACPYQNQ